MSQGTVVIGAQWGDEGKGKLVDLLSQEHDFIVRFQGGNNAGHTLIVDGQEIVLHTIPSGALYEDKVNIIGNGVVLDPKICLQEINNLKALGYLQKEDNLKISSRVNLIMPYHRAIDIASEKKSEKKIGTTGRGIGPAYSDKIARKGIRICDVLYDPQGFKDKLRIIMEEKNFLLKNLYKEKTLKLEDVYEEYLGYIADLKPYVCDTAFLIESALKYDKKVLFEGAQGVLLDIDHGTYPFVTSSNTVAGAVCVGAPIGVTCVSRVIGIVKAYSTRVGEGPYPTELEDENGEALRKRGNEFGATTGRARRCGWLDLVALRYSTLVSGVTELAITKLDILSGFEKIDVCVSYQINNKIVDHFPPTSEILDQVEPVYHTLEGWDCDISKVRNYNDLPDAAKKYISFIEDFLKLKVSIVSVSPEREGIIRKD